MDGEANGPGDHPGHEKGFLKAAGCQKAGRISNLWISVALGFPLSHRKSIMGFRPQYFLDVKLQSE
jgi:hypothetical protein